MNTDNDTNSDDDDITSRIDRFMRENAVISLNYVGMLQHFKDSGLLEKPGYTWGFKALEYLGIFNDGDIEQTSDYADDILKLLISVGAAVPKHSEYGKENIKLATGYYDHPDDPPAFSVYRWYRFDYACPAAQLIKLFCDWRNGLPEDIRSRACQQPYPSLLKRLVADHLRRNSDPTGRGLAVNPAASA
jgi:hypothetical protein